MAESMAARPGVCILIGAFFPVVGGGETHARLLGRELARTGHRVMVVTRRTARTLDKVEALDGMTVYRVTAPASPRLGKYVMMLPAFVRLIALRKQYDVIYVCALRVLGVVGILAARLLRKKCVLRSEACGELSGDFIRHSFHSGTATSLNPLVRTLLAWRNRLYMRADRFLSISGLIDAEFRACGVPPDKVASIACGIDTERFTPVDPVAKQRLRARLHLPDGFIFAYSGKLIKGKGLEGLLEVWNTIAARRTDVHLLLVGGGGEHFLSCEQVLREQVAALGLDDRVTFTGYVAAVEACLQAADAFVFPSLKESFGLAPLEAMACGIPVVATEVGELPRVITHGQDGLLVAPGHAGALGDAMQRLLDEPSLAQAMGPAGRETVVARVGIRHVARRHAALLAELCDDRGKA